jgi:hypothetical protein
MANGIRQTNTGVVQTSSGVVQTVSTTPNLTIDNFEDGPNGPYGGSQDITDFYSGDTSIFSRQTGTVIDGSQTLQATGTTSNSAISSTSGLPNYPSQGDTWEFKIQLTDTSAGAHSMLFATQSENGWSNLTGYASWVGAAGNSLQIRELTGGDATPLVSTNFNFADNTTYRLETTWGTDNSIEVELFESGVSQTSISTTDSTYTSGGTGWHHNHGTSSESAFFDSAKIL